MTKLDMETLAGSSAPYNPRRISLGAAEGLGMSLESFGDISGIVYNVRTGNLVCGHQRVAQLHAKGAQVFQEDGRPVVRIARGDIDGFAIRLVDWDEPTEKAANIAANNQAISGEFTEGLQPLLDEVELSLGSEAFEGLRLDELRAPDSSADDQYTRKIEPPTYEPKKTHPPRINELFDTTKRDELLQRIAAQELPKDVRRFLAEAASRHVVFNYENIAEFYCHARPEVQRLMEASALVIIDFGQAMSEGFVKLTKAMAETFDD